MGKIISFANQKGGTGKTTLAINLAVLWSNSGYKVAVLDLGCNKNIIKCLSERGCYVNVFKINYILHK